MYIREEKLSEAIIGALSPVDAEAFRLAAPDERRLMLQTADAIVTWVQGQALLRVGNGCRVSRSST
jgi:hypothetical protein